jgi:hypothetical protein
MTLSVLWGCTDRESADQAKEEAIRERLAYYQGAVLLTRNAQQERSLLQRLIQDDLTARLGVRMTILDRQTRTERLAWGYAFTGQRPVFVGVLFALRPDRPGDQPKILNALVFPPHSMENIRMLVNAFVPPPFHGAALTQ